MSMTPLNPQQQQLIVSCQGLVRSIAWKVRCKLPAHVDLEDLVGYGQVGLAEAARDFDPSRGSQFTTFAYYRVRGAILDGLSKMAWFNRSDYYQGRYEQMANDVLGLEDSTTGQNAAVEEDARWLKGVTSALAVVYLFSRRAGEGGAESQDVEDKASESPESIAEESELSRKLHELIDALPPDAAAIIRAAYFDGLTLKEAGENLGVSKAWASRLHARALGQLARSLRISQLAD
jgi:RNA polymerase sigma factor for flagellar operon FliA